MTDMGDASIVHGMTVNRDLNRGTLTISQEPYVGSILERYEVSSCNPVSTPGSGSELSNNCENGDFLDSAGVKLYQSIVGSLQYLVQITIGTTYLTRSTSYPGHAADPHLLIRRPRSGSCATSKEHLI